MSKQTYGEVLKGHRCKSKILTTIDKKEDDVIDVHCSPTSCTYKKSDDQISQFDFIMETVGVDPVINDNSPLLEYASYEILGRTRELLLSSFDFLIDNPTIFKVFKFWVNEKNCVELRYRDGQQAAFAKALNLPFTTTNRNIVKLSEHPAFKGILKFNQEQKKFEKFSEQLNQIISEHSCKQLITIIAYLIADSDKADTRIKIMRYWLGEMGSTLINGGSGQISKIAEALGVSGRTVTDHIKFIAAHPILSRVFAYNNNHYMTGGNVTQKYNN